MQKEEAAQTPSKGLMEAMKRFLKTPYFWVLSLILLSVLCSFILVYMGCFAYIFIPIFMFAVPFWLREKRIKRFLLNGIIIGILMVFIADIVFTSAVIGPDFKSLPDLTQGTVTLSQGSVVPYKGSGSPNYSFSVVYKNSNAVQPINVNVSLVLFDLVAQTDSSYDMTWSINEAGGWKYYRNMTVPEGVYEFGFKQATDSTSGWTNSSTDLRLGPLNAPWLTYYWVFLPIIAFTLILPVSMYYIIVGLYWWTERARQMRGPLPPRPSKIEEKVEEKGEFECTNCGATVPEDALRCPKCGAIFEEEEPEKKDKGEGKASDFGFKEQEESWKKR